MSELHSEGVSSLWQYHGKYQRNVFSKAIKIRIVFSNTMNK